MLLEVFTQRHFVAELIRFKLIFIHKMTNLLFEPPFGGLRDNHTDFIYSTLESVWPISYS